MARKRTRNSGTVNTNGWLVTFSDLITLLLTFFVLILSISTLDTGILADAFTIFTGKVGFLTSQSAGKVEERFSLLRDIMRDPPWTVMEKQERIKDLLFPKDAMPPGLTRATLDRNLDILANPEGVALVISDAILFRPGGSELSPQAAAILDQVAGLVPVLSMPVVISGHTDDIPGKDVDNFELSSRRALAVLDLFLGHRLDPRLFAVAGYGPLRPVTDNATPDGQARNRRVEILFKTLPYAKTYL